MFALSVLRKKHPTVIEMLLTGWSVATVKSGYTYYVTTLRTEVIMFAAHAGSAVVKKGPFCDFCQVHIVQR